MGCWISQRFPCDPSASRAGGHCPPRGDEQRDLVEHLPRYHRSGHHRLIIREMRAECNPNRNHRPFSPTIPSITFATDGFVFGNGRVWPRLDGGAARVTNANGCALLTAYYGASVKKSKQSTVGSRRGVPFFSWRNFEIVA
jgi:hypothetical protein